MKMTTLCYIEKEGKYLMLHRVKKHHDINAGKWIGVGGHVENGETPEECLLREVKEETGLVLTAYRLRGLVTFLSVQEQVREAKKDAETRRNFMEFEYKQMLIAKDAREKALAEGREKGHKEATVENYSSLVQKGKLSLSDAISLSGLSEQEINGWIQAHSNI